MSAKMFVCPLSVLWLFGLFADDVFYLSLSGAGETQTPFGGFGVPLVFFPSWTRSTSSIRTSSPSPTSRLRPAPIFFSRRRRSFSGGGCSWVVVVALGPSFEVVLARCACLQTRLTEKGWPTRRRPNYMTAIIFSFWVEREAVSRTVRPEPLVLLPPPPAVP